LTVRGAATYNEAALFAYAFFEPRNLEGALLEQRAFLLSTERIIYVVGR
jgi:hypothetical protein